MRVIRWESACHEKKICSTEMEVVRHSQREIYFTKQVNSSTSNRLMENKCINEKILLAGISNRQFLKIVFVLSIKSSKSLHSDQTTFDWTMKAAPQQK